MKYTPPYSIFARIYDRSMNHVRFHDWADFIIREYNVNSDSPPGSLLDLGCGTGLLLKGFPATILHKTGVDISGSMIRKAKENFPEGEFLEMDIRNFSFPRQYELVVSSHDSLNYITKTEELISHFKCVYDVLCDHGFYFFDLSSEYNLLTNFHGKTFNESYFDAALQWSNKYSQETKEIFSTLEFTLKNNGVKKKITELHVQRYYEKEEILEILKLCGFKLIRTGSDYKKWEDDPTASLMNFVVRKVQS